VTLTDWQLDLVSKTPAPRLAFGGSDSFLFDPVYFLLAQPSLRSSHTFDTALQAYFSGAAAGGAPNFWFDASYYRAKWNDLATLDDATLFKHFNLYGVWEGRSAGPKFDHFDGDRYLSGNPDVAAYVDGNLGDFLGSRSNGAMAHFPIYGAAEGRTAVDLAGQPIDLDYLFAV
jgi:hypothetical protein